MILLPPENELKKSVMTCGSTSLAAEMFAEHQEDGYGIYNGLAALFDDEEFELLLTRGHIRELFRESANEAYDKLVWLIAFKAVRADQTFEATLAKIRQEKTATSILD